MDTRGIPESESRKYLDLFMKADYFAVIKAGGECLDDYLLYALRELHGLGLYPILIHGGGKQIDSAMNAGGIEIEKKEGIRVTDKTTVTIAERVLKEVNSELVFRINQGGYYARGLNKVFYVDGEDPDYGYVGNIIGMDKERIDSCLKDERIPVISSLGVDLDTDQTHNPNADSVFSFTVQFLKPEVSMFLINEGGIIKDGDIVSEMSHEELLGMMNSGYFYGGMRPKIEETLKLSRAGFDVRLVSPEHMMLELFSKKGRGTYINGMVQRTPEKRI